MRLPPTMAACGLSVDNAVINRTGGCGNRATPQIGGRSLGRDPGGGQGPDPGLGAAQAGARVAHRGVPRAGSRAGAAGEPDEKRTVVLSTPIRRGGGGGGRDGRMAAVFAQLITGGERRGVHVVLVPIRDERGRPCPNVRIEDCGDKGGLNGVDNGRLWFENVRVPREALLDRFGSVARDGTYTSPIANDTRRFFTMLGTLVSGRVSVSGAGLSAAKLALAIAIRYGLRRRQFRVPGGDEEVILLDYLQHQRRLLPALATTYALHFAQSALVASLHSARDGDSADAYEQRAIETVAACLQAVSTWHSTQTIQTCREACGGAGYLSVNRLTELRADTDIFTTFEGDNTVLLQLVAKGLLTNFRDEFGSMDTVA